MLCIQKLSDFLSGETDAPNETTISTVVSEQPEESERVPESDDDFSNPSLGSLMGAMRSYRLLLLDDNKSAASCQQA